MEAYEGCHEPLIRYCSALAFGKMDTEDLVQDVLLAAYQHFEKIRNKGQLLHYMIRVARNRSVSKWRKARFQTEMLDSHADKLKAQGVSPEMLLDIELLHRMLDRLPVKQKEAILLFEISGFSMREIAEIQGCNPGAIKTKISRGRKRLRQLMAERHSAFSAHQVLQTLQTVTL